MAIKDINKLGFLYTHAVENFEDAKEKEKENDYDIDLTLERVESAGFLDGYGIGGVLGFKHAIALLNAEGFTEHAKILDDQLKTVLEILGAGE